MPKSKSFNKSNLVSRSNLSNRDRGMNDLGELVQDSFTVRKKLLGGCGAVIHTQFKMKYFGRVHS